MPKFWIILLLVFGSATPDVNGAHPGHQRDEGSIKLKVIKGITRVLEYASWITLSGLSLLVAYQVIARYIFNNPSSWSEELARIVFIYLTFFGAALAVKRGRSLRITVFLDRLPKKLRFISYNVINGTITIAFLLFGVYYSYWLVDNVQDIVY